MIVTWEGSGSKAFRHSFIVARKPIDPKKQLDLEITVTMSLFRVRNGKLAMGCLVQGQNANVVGQLRNTRDCGLAERARTTLKPATDPRSK